MPDTNIVQELTDAHARLRKLESELEAIRSQLRPAKKRIFLARQALDALVEELASGQSSLPLFRTEEPQASNGQPPSAETEADRQPVRAAPLAFASAKSKRRKEATP